MGREFTARQIINSLSTEEIDEEIDALEDELKGLKELKKVAVKMQGKPTAEGGRRRKKSSKSAPEEVASLVRSALAAGPLDMQDLCDSTGLSQGKLRPTISRVPGVSKVDGLWTLTGPQNSGSD